MTHAEFVRNLLIELSKIQNVIVWPNQTGVAKSLTGERVIRYGLNGSADITGIAKCEKSGIGIRIEIECKVGKDRIRIHQSQFRAMIQAHGGLYIEARNIQETVDTLNEYIKNL